MSGKQKYFFSRIIHFSMITDLPYKPFPYKNQKIPSISQSLTQINSNLSNQTRERGKHTHERVIIWLIIVCKWRWRGQALASHILSDSMQRHHTLDLIDPTILPPQSLLNSKTTPLSSSTLCTSRSPLHLLFPIHCISVSTRTLHDLIRVVLTWILIQFSVIFIFIY